VPLFTDRTDAGRRLAAALAPFRGERPVVLGLPRGGVPVAFEVAQALDAPLDVLVARKLGAPGHPELAIGALAPGAVYVDEAIVRDFAVPRAYLERVIAAESHELARRELAYRKGRPPLDVRGRSVVLVDDGLATGSTARAAVESLRRRGAARIIFAAPVGAPESAVRLRSQVDDLVCLALPPEFRAVSLAYQDFAPTTDEEVLACLESARSGGPAGAPN
jgi:putative phosphoribosyl transferase